VDSAKDRIDELNLTPLQNCIDQEGQEKSAD